MKYEEKINEDYFSYNNIKTLLIIYFLHSGHDHSSVHVKKYFNTTFIFSVSFYFAPDRIGNIRFPIPY